jgi:predicted phosphodiesterase
MNGAPCLSMLKRMGSFDPAIRRHFRGMNHVLHAGDIGNRSVIEQLEMIASGTFVSGNVDGYEESGFSIERSSS